MKNHDREIIDLTIEDPDFSDTDSSNSEESDTDGENGEEKEPDDYSDDETNSEPPLSPLYMSAEDIKEHYRVSFELKKRKFNLRDATTQTPQAKRRFNADTQTDDVNVHVDANFLADLDYLFQN